MRKASIIRLALQSRLLVLVLQFVFNLIIPDHNAGVFLHLKSNNTDKIPDKVVNTLFGGFLRWDGHYFMHIAKYGYTYENTLAFFPLYPITVRYISEILSKFLHFLNFDSVLLVTFLAFNVGLFCSSALCLYKLTQIFFSRDFAYKAAVLFCFNPASIFFSAPYSECFFSYLTFKSILNCVLFYQKYSDTAYRFHIKDILYVTPIALSCLTRSNGLLNIGFFIFTFMCITLQKFDDLKLKTLMRYVVVTLCGILLSLLPFLCFQYYMYREFCSDFNIQLSTEIQKYAAKKQYVLPGEFSRHNQSWCSRVVPLSYSYVQMTYWDVGFLKYYCFKQIPNFLLALPILILVLNYTLTFLWKNLKFNVKSIFSFNTNLSRENINIFHPVLLVYVVHVFALTLFCIFFVHIQVTTRMLLSSSPVVYWFCAYQFLGMKVSGDENITNFFLHKARNPIQKFIKYYFLSYLSVGTIMFCNFLPWT